MSDDHERLSKVTALLPALAHVQLVLVDERPTYALARWGPARQILLSRALVDQAPADALLGCLAHEYAHLLLGDDPSQRRNRRLSWAAIGALFALAGGLLVYLLVQLARQQPHTTQPADGAVAVAIFVVALLGAIFFLRNSRRLERHVDALAVELLGTTAPTLAMIAWLQQHERRAQRLPRFLATHPSNAARLKALGASTSAASVATAPLSSGWRSS